MPGCEIVVARKGKVIYEKSFGKQNYQDSIQIQDSTLYDIASISKVAGTLQAVMFLYEQGEINLDSTISTYLPELKGTNKANIFIREVLTHQAGLQPFIEHNKKTMENGNLKDTY
jgi:CubicO group peptidase (beta-lactamase class C family)